MAWARCESTGRRNRTLQARAASADGCASTRARSAVSSVTRLLAGSRRVYAIRCVMWRCPGVQSSELDLVARPDSIRWRTRQDSNLRPSGSLLQMLYRTELRVHKTKEMV